MGCCSWQRHHQRQLTFLYSVLSIWNSSSLICFTIASSTSFAIIIIIIVFFLHNHQLENSLFKYAILWPRFAGFFPLSLSLRVAISILCTTYFYLHSIWKVKWMNSMDGVFCVCCLLTLGLIFCSFLLLLLFVVEYLWRWKNKIQLK